MSRNYRGDVDINVIEKFMPLLVEQEDEGKSSPIIQRDDLSYIYIKHMNIYREFPKNLTCLSGIFLSKHIFSCIALQEKRECCDDSLISL